jgi:hypothetical protein
VVEEIATDLVAMETEEDEEAVEAREVAQI